MTLNNKNNIRKTTIFTTSTIMLMVMIMLPTITPIFAITPDVTQSYAPKPVMLDKTGKLMPLSGSSAPYVAAYHDTSPHFGIYSAKVTCNFSGTDRSKIQSDNYLTCVGSLQNPTSTSREDWGYQAYVTLKQTGNLIVGADVWKGCENIFPSTPCNGTTAGSVDHKYSNSQFITANPSDDITVFMEMANTGTVSWYYQVNSGSKTLFGTWSKATEQNTYFNTGTYLVARYFQAGVGSAYNIGQSGWYANVKNPAYATSYGGAYNSYYSPAKSTDGTHSYWDGSFAWGGAVYTGVNADYNCKSGTTSAGQAKFQYTGTTLSDGTKLWGVC
ncbi:MAG: hypothetical protein ACREA5_00730 [Nitrosotalea sp.]